MLANTDMMIILGALHTGPKTIHDLQQMLSKSVSYFWSGCDRNIQAAVSAGIREGTMVANDQSYQISDEGKLQFAQWMRERSQPIVIQDEFTAKIFFGGCIEPGVSRSQLTDFIDTTRARLEAYTEQKGLLAQLPFEKNILTHWMLALSYGEAIANAQLAWAESAMSTLAVQPQL